MTSVLERLGPIKPKVPVTVVTGFLGAGKSTLLNHLLTDQSHGLKFAVIENELGAVAIDNQILARHVDEEIIEVTNGCICCSIRGDLVRALNNLYEKVESFDGVLLETTGLADPAPIIQTFFQNQEIANKYKLDGVLTVVDAKHILQRLAEVKPEGVVNEATEQVAFADRILLNKVDLVPEGSTTTLEQIEEELKQINPTVSIIRTTNSIVENPEEALLQLGGFDLGRALKLDADFLKVERRHRKDRRVGSVCCQVPGEVNLYQVQEWVGGLLSAGHNPTNNNNDDHSEHKDSVGNHDHDHDHDQEATTLYRYKGVFAIKGMSSKFIFQGVGMLFKGHFDREQKWGENEPRVSQFVFIGKNLDAAELKSGFEACLVTKELRFAVGVEVEAMQGIWKQGTVIKHWDEGNCYRIRLKEEQKEIWAPLDIDEVVRSYSSSN